MSTQPPQPPQGPPTQPLPPEGWQPPQQPRWGPPPGQQPPWQGPQPGWGPPGQGAPTQPLPAWGTPPPQPPRKQKKPIYKRWWVIALGIIVLFGIIGTVAGDDPSQEPESAATRPQPTSAQTTKPEATAEPETTAKPATTARQSDLRRAMRDGQFEFVVNSVKCGRSTVGSAGLEQRAQGQYCLVSVRVENIGKEARTFDSSSQYLYDTGGRRFETDEATLYVEEFGKAFLENINPGNSVNGTLVYDVPKSFEAGKLELHDSPFSGGVEVRL